MPKNIVLCSDGTGNAAEKNRGTNVFKLFEAVDFQTPERDSPQPLQVAFYDDGVGTENFKPLKIIGGAFGYGLERNVRQLYTELARVYEPGDRIYLFGFSRGAFTVRTLAGIIGQVGIVDRVSAGTDAELERFVKLAFAEHRRCYQRWLSKKLGRKLDPKLADRFRDRYSVKHPVHAPDGHVRIAFIGVWDTVDAVGFPIDEVSQLWNALIYPFRAPDTKLNPYVDSAAHAIAIDDERYTFHPVLWDERAERTHRIQQVWFSGVHSNVGGGYPKQGMSLVSLVWMMDLAERSGLRFVPSARTLYFELKNVNDKLYDSRSGLASYYRYKPRDIEAVCLAAGIQPKVHLSVIGRIALGVERYSPGNLPNHLEVVSNAHPDIAAAATRLLSGESPRLLSDARSIVLLRRACHSAVVFLTLFMVACLAWYTVDVPSLRGLGAWDATVTAVVKLAALGSSAGIWNAIKSLAASQTWSVLALGVVWLIMWRLRVRQDQAYAEYWYKRRRALRKLFEALPKADAAYSSE
ncbi:MAG TPA: DUF2235 domain-containing protein [Bryobacteraceae bacterium]|nr:DUF2235 domain-containing protein [Bryobacteraceae bacterium]